MSDADLAIRLLAADPAGLRGIVLRAPAGPRRDAWIAALRAGLPDGVAVRRMPAGIADDRLLGGIDLPATLAAGRPVMAQGFLAESDGAVILVPMAERLSPETAARLAQALDTGEVPDAAGGTRPARFALVLLDEGIDDETVPAALADRLALHLSLPAPEGGEAGSAPQPLFVETLCHAAEALGSGGVRVALMAVKAARASAALAGRTVAEADVEAAVRLVLAPRATRLPAPDEQAASEPPPPPPGDPGAETAQQPEIDQLTELAIEAARAMLPPDVLIAQQGRAGGRARGQGAGKLGQSASVGRRSGVRQGPLGRGARLDLVETLKAAAPWQPIRRREAPGRPGVQVRQGDFRIRRLVKRNRALTLFLVDASGSQALARLGEAKGAVELLLAQSYVRRDEVALIAFRGPGAELLLPPTRSLARAKRALGDLPGGGGTPLAAGLEAATHLLAAAAARERSLSLVLLTDGRANLARADELDPMADAESAARAIRRMGIRAVLIDTSARPRPEAARIAEALGARLLPLPRADAQGLAAAVQAAA